MHIVYVISPGGGPEAYVRTLGPWLRQAGHEVTVVSSAPLAFDNGIQAVVAAPTSAHYYLSKMVGRRRAWSLRLRAWEWALAMERVLSRLQDRRPIDVIEVTEGIPVLRLARRWAIVLRAHGSDWTFRYFCNEGEPKYDGWLIRQEAAQLRRAHVVGAISAHLAEHLSAACEFPCEQFRVIPYPIDAAQFRAGPKRDRADGPIILSIGRIERRKGMDLLTQAMPRVWEDFPTAELHILGREADLTCDALRAMTPIEKRRLLKFPGFLPRDQVAATYGTANLYVTASLYETFAYTILEAMSAGLPIVATRTGAIPELIRDGVNGRLVAAGDTAALADAIVDLLTQPAIAQALGAVAHCDAAKFTLESVGTRLVKLYDTAMAAKARER